jgi:hypothetical protein
MCRSVRHTPQAATRNRTCFGRSSGRGTSTICRNGSVAARPERQIAAFKCSSNILRSETSRSWIFAGDQERGKLIISEKRRMRCAIGHSYREGGARQSLGVLAFSHCSWAQIVQTRVLLRKKCKFMSQLQRSHDVRVLFKERKPRTWSPKTTHPDECLVHYGPESCERSIFGIASGVLCKSRH